MTAEAAAPYKQQHIDTGALKSVQSPGGEPFLAVSRNRKIETGFPLPHPNNASQGQQSFGRTTGAQPSSANVHIIFSTDCSPFQNWQSVVVYYSAAAVGQEGPITRIASGCSEEEQESLRKMHQDLSPQFRVHFTPDYSLDEKTGKRYLFFNKPRGLLHWATNAHFNETIVALLDPDMLLLSPITGTFPPGNFLVSRDWKPGEEWAKVEKGRPAAQQYGLGSHWLSFRREYICGAGSPCLETTHAEANKYFPVGAPYVVHVADLTKLAETWVEFVPKIYEEYPELLAEMYGVELRDLYANLGRA